jgi:hypothetical protein
MNWLIQFIDYKHISVLSFEKKIGVRSTIQKAIKGNSNLGSNLLAKIVVEFPDINPEWLLTGKGEMLRNSEEIKEESNPTDKKLIAALEKNVMYLEKELEDCKSEKKLLENNKSNV